MMSRNWLFEDPEMVSRFERELSAWAGTPFWPRMAQRGVGVDCVRFAFAVLQNLDVIGPIDWPRYPIRGGGREIIGIIEERVIADCGLECVWLRPRPRAHPTYAALPGDILVATDPIHFALQGPDADLWHAQFPGGVQHGVCASDPRARAFAIFRAPA